MNYPKTHVVVTPGQRFRVPLLKGLQIVEHVEALKEMGVEIALETEEPTTREKIAYEIYLAREENERLRRAS